MFAPQRQTIVHSGKRRRPGKYAAALLDDLGGAYRSKP